MGELIAFYGIAGLMLASALVVIWARSPVTSLLALLITMFGMAALFVLLGAVFLAALQILLYAGAVLVLFLFVVMLLNLDRQTLQRAKLFTGRWVAVGLVTWLLLQLGWIFSTGATQRPWPPSAAAPTGTIVAVGRLLFRDYLLPFELTSLLILVAIIGAVALAQRKPE